MQARVLAIGRDSIAEAARMVSGGGIVVYPTDTVYGLGADPHDSAAVEEVFAAKRREAKPIPVLCESFEKASELVDLSGAAGRLARMYWPGALTVVAPMRVKMPSALDQGTGMLGVRVPALESCLALLGECGGALTGTSANISGMPPCRSAAEALKELGERVDLILDGGRLTGASSTVVKVGPGGIEAIREGPVRVPEEFRRV
jgi:L-threonylcarbamoyladenylate synthase